MNYSIRRQLTPTEKDRFAGMSDLTAHLLFHRGITERAAAERFLAPDYERDTHDPFLLKDAEKAADRIIRAMKGGEKIAIYADYDADGIPGAAMWDDFFRRISFAGYVIYIPHRHNEGFGLNADAVEQLAGQGVKLLVTLDCGITDTAAVARGRELGLDVIITDHHEPPVSAETGREALPAAFAIVDHKQADCAYPDKELCGTGVGFKLIQAILAKDRFGLKEGHEKWLLDLVGMATLSDMVSLTGENRVFAHYGLQVLRKSPRKGLVRLLARLRIAQAYLSEDDIAFMITPRINAASRMGVPMDAFDLLAADSDEKASAAAEHLDLINTERKGVVAALVKEVKKTVRTRHGEDATAFPSVIVLGNPAWRPSLLGLAANSCAEEFRRPVFLWGRDGDDLIKGSCRSEGNTHVVELMRAAPAATFSQFGGHRHSGGFAVGNDEVHFLEQRLNEAAAGMKRSAEERQKGKKAEKQKAESRKEGEESQQFQDIADDTGMIDAELSLGQVTYRLHSELDRLAPFGVGNKKPIFLFKNVSPLSVRRFGKGDEHVEIVFDAGGGKKVPAISFFGAALEWAHKVKPEAPLDLVASIEKSMFRGRPELRLRVVDIVCG